MPSCPVLSCPVLSYTVPSYTVPSYTVPSYTAPGWPCWPTSPSSAWPRASGSPGFPAVKARLHLTDGLLGALLLAGPGALVLVMPLAGWLADRFGSARLTRPAGLAVAILPLALWTATVPAAVVPRPTGVRYRGGHAGRGRERAGRPGGKGLPAAADGLVPRVLQPGRAGRGGTGRSARLVAGRRPGQRAGQHRPGRGGRRAASPVAGCCPSRPGCARAGRGGRGPA